MAESKRAAPTFFETPIAFRTWLARNHSAARELLVGFYKRDSGKLSITWPESVDEVLCVGWIDGVRRSLGADSYTIRFSPRKPTSIWSAVNVARVRALTKDKRMRPAGLAAFKARIENKVGIYAYEQRSMDLPEPYAGMLRRNAKAWRFFEAQPPYYRKTMMWYVASAKREATRLARLERLISDSAAGRRTT